MSKAVFAVLGGVVGAIGGYFTAYHIVLMSEDSCMAELAAIASGWIFGVPIGGIAFCVLGFRIGSTLNRRSRHNGSQIEESDSI